MAFTLRIENLHIHEAGLLTLLSNSQRLPAPSKGHNRTGQEGEQVPSGELQEHSKEYCHLPVWTQIYHWWYTTPKYLWGFWQWSLSTPVLCRVNTDFGPLPLLGRLERSLSFPTMLERTRQGWVLWAVTESQGQWCRREHYEDNQMHRKLFLFRSFGQHPAQQTDCSSVLHASATFWPIKICYMHNQQNHLLNLNRKIPQPPVYITSWEVFLGTRSPFPNL